MKGTSILALVGVTALLALTACNSFKPATPKALALFNGRNLDGWTHVLADPSVPRDAVWSVQDGLLVCKGTPLGVLQTKRAFQNFRFVLEYRWAPGTKPGNSGILTRINGPARPLPRCTEAQLQHGNAGHVLGLHGMMVAAGQPRYFEILNHEIAGDIRAVKHTENAENPAGEWNRVEVLAQGDTYTVWVNGKQVNHVTGIEVIAGPLGLQSEGGEIHFRKAELTPLPN